jgi:hypothetical protein
MFKPRVLSFGPIKLDVNSHVFHLTFECPKQGITKLNERTTFEVR